MEKRVLYFDCFSGISGDMTIGALLDLGIDREEFLSRMKKINLDEFELEIKPGIKKGITGTDFTVHIQKPALDEHEHHHAAHEHHHHHAHGEHHHHGHEHHHAHAEWHAHCTPRNLSAS